jgi:uncharacterized sulfatase
MPQFVFSVLARQLKRFFMPVLLGGLGLAAPAAMGAAPTPQRPNIVFILSDDLGWRDLGISGSQEHRTPNLDKLAAEGMRFTRAYAPAPICSASRAAILTGKSPARLHFEFVVKFDEGHQGGDHPLQTPAFTLELPLEETTMGEALQADGYTTAYFGKWHVSKHTGGYLGWSHTHGPLQQGFEVGDSEFGSHPYGYGGKDPGFDPALSVGDYPDDALTDLAVDYIGQKHEQPFFLFLAHYYVHSPIHSRARWLVDGHRPELPGKRAMYAAMVETLDELVGRVMAALDEARLAENTVVVFSSDNGGHPGFATNGPLRGGKWNLYEAGVRVPLFIAWPGHIPADSVCDVPVVLTDLFPTFCQLAGGQAPVGDDLDGVSLVSLWEGGAFPAQRPLVWHFPYYHPEPAKDWEQAPDVTGVNDYAVSKTYPQSSILLGDYKLMHFYEDDRDELYMLSEDPGEQHDLSAAQPETARELRAELEAYLNTVDARRPEPRKP